MGKGQQLLEVIQTSYRQLTLIYIANRKSLWMLDEQLFFLPLCHSEMLTLYSFFFIEHITFIVLN